MSTDGTPLTSTYRLWTFNPHCLRADVTSHMCELYLEQRAKYDCTQWLCETTASDNNAVSWTTRVMQIDKLWTEREVEEWRMWEEWQDWSETQAPLCLMQFDRARLFPRLCAAHWEALNLPEQTGDRSVLSHRDFCVFNPFLLLRPATRLHNFTGLLCKGEKDILKVHPP